MKVLMINGSRREKGCTYTALSVVAKALNEENIDTEIIYIGKDAVNGKIDEAVKNAAQKMKESDALIVGSPVYYAGPTGEVIAFLDRLSSVAESDLRLKPAACITSARRAGTTATLDDLGKYFAFAEMPVVSSRYWNMVHGSSPADVEQDEEGKQIMTVLGKNMAWILRCIEAGKKAGIEKPGAVKKTYTNFIR